MPFETNFKTKMIVALIPIDVVTNWFLPLSWSLCIEQKRKSIFYKVGGLVTKYISVFCS